MLLDVCVTLHTQARIRTESREEIHTKASKSWRGSGFQWISDQHRLQYSLHSFCIFIVQSVYFFLKKIKSKQDRQPWLCYAMERCQREMLDTEDLKACGSDGACPGTINGLLQYKLTLKK